MAKKTKTTDTEQDAIDAKDTALHKKIAEYMGPLPDNPANDKPHPKTAENLVKKSGIKIVVQANDELPDSTGTELLPSDKIPVLVKPKSKPTIPKEPEPIAEDPTEPVIPLATEEPIVDSMSESDPETDKAVDEIVASEGDQVLAAEDEQKLKETEPEPKKSLKQKLKYLLAAWWGNPKYRKLTLISAGVLLFVLFFIPSSRYFVLNTVGVRASASLVVLDESTSQPLKNVNVSIGTSTSQTDKEGNVKLTKLRLGPAKLLVEKRAFAKAEREITVGWGSNPLGEYALTPTGARYTFVVTDWLSTKPVAKAEATSGDASAVSDNEGKIVLTVDNADATELQVQITADTYRIEQLSINADTKDEQALSLVPGRKHVFVSKRAGKYDLYKIDVDGKNEELLLGGTGNERSDMGLSVHPTNETAAFVSTRDKVRNKDGFLLSQLYLVDIKSSEKILLASSEKIELIGWSGERLIYVKIAEGASAANPKRHLLISYDFKNQESKELASANYFNDVLNIGSTVYFAPAASHQPDVNIGFFRINSDGSNRTTILTTETWNMIRVSFNKLSIAVPGDWYEYTVGEKEAKKASGAPSSTRNRFYINNPDNTQSLWIDERDGQTVLLAYDIGAKTDKIIRTEKGIETPISWLSNNHVVYRLNNGHETADYAINLDGGEAKKIRDVTNTSGLDSWYYY